jgi:hypothetical protein
MALIASRLELQPDITAEFYRAATDPVGGLAKDAAFDFKGFETVLRLRAQAESTTLSAPETYYDLTFHQRALASL